VQFCLLAMSQQVRYSSGRDVEGMLVETAAFLQMAVDGEIGVLDGTPLISAPNRSDILSTFCHFIAPFFTYRTPFTEDLCAYLLQFMASDNEMDQAEVIGALMDFIEHGTVSHEAHVAILGAVAPAMERASQPTLLRNVSCLFNVLVQASAGAVPTVVGALPVLERWRAIGTAAGLGHQDVLADIASLYLQLAVRVPDFGVEQTLAALGLFRPFDIAETASIVRTIVELAQWEPEIAIAMGLVIARYVVLSESKVAKAGVPPEVVQQLLAFKQLVAQSEALMARITARFGRQPWKRGKIMAALR